MDLAFVCAVANYRSSKGQLPHRNAVSLASCREEDMQDILTMLGCDDRIRTFCEHTWGQSNVDCVLLCTLMKARIWPILKARSIKRILHEEQQEKPKTPRCMHSSSQRSRVSFQDVRKCRSSSLSRLARRDIKSQKSKTRSLVSLDCSFRSTTRRYTRISDRDIALCRLSNSILKLPPRNINTSL